LPRVVGDEDEPLAGRLQRLQRFRRPRNRLAADPDDPIEVDQKSIEAVGKRHRRTLFAQIDTVQAVSVNGQVVVANDLYRRYGEGDAAVDALAGVTTSFERDRFTAIMGPSGSGKSTLMHILAGLDRPTAGTVELDGVEITKLDDGELTKLRRDKLGFVFQFFNLLPVLTAEENLVLPLSIAGRKPDQQWVETLIRTVGLEDRRTHRPAELSGGQQQRVAVARALVSKPAVVFADEPTGNLDSKASADVLALLRQAVDEFGQTVVMVTHDPAAAAHADRLITLQDGKIVNDAAPGSADDVIELQKRLD
jgi:putative ABC transport system ATP-binding protein